MFDRLTLAQVVWLFPPAFALHVLEEAPGFTAWVRQHASKRFTQADFYRNNAVGLAIGILCCALVALVPNRATVFLFFVLALTQAFFNVFFHVGSTLVYGAYSPGLVTALALHLPLTYVLSHLAMREGWLGKASVAAAFLLGAAIHVAVVARQVYFLERRSPNRRVAARSLRN